jgi:hypothetical protein
MNEFCFSRSSEEQKNRTMKSVAMLLCDLIPKKIFFLQDVYNYLYRNTIPVHEFKKVMFTGSSAASLLQELTINKDYCDDLIATRVYFNI